MTIASPEGAARRVLLVFRSGSPLEASLEIARSIAATTQAELDALYVRDRNLLDIAEHSALFEVGAASGLARPMSEAGVLSALDLEARKVRHAVADMGAFSVEAAISSSM